MLADDPVAIVRAQVGSGKTTVLVHKVMYLHLVGGVALDDVAVVTFTNRAADQLIARLEALAGRAITAAERARMGTLHGVAHALLQRTLPVARVGHQPGFAVLDDDARDALYAELVKQHRLRLRGRARLHERLRAHAGRAAGDDGGPSGAALTRLAAAIHDAKRARNAMDFDDLIEHATALLGEPDAPPPPRWLLVDELQDCEARELALLRRLRGADTRFFGVGDPLQSIYGWRGGCAAMLGRLERELGARRRDLPFSYRSTRTILDGARAALGAQPDADGALRPVRGAGAPIQVRRHHDPLTEAIYLADRVAQLRAGGVPAAAIAVLCRLRVQVEALTPRLIEHGVPCATDGDDRADAVRVLTLHAAKGLEFGHVFISGANLGVVPLVVRGEPADPAEERRLLYVGLTRARDEVEVSYHASPHTFGALGSPSPLLLQLPAALVTWHDAAVPPAAATSSPPPPRLAPAPTATAAPAPVATTVDAATAVATPATSTAPAPWSIGQTVRHPRYGVGVVIDVAAATVACDFGKLGPRSFPLRLCPLRAEPPP
ncbi:MAG: ATP-dependent helicase [Kofleriaceae bacterium]|nr:ATP-dependent helicase [Kofleriaceae bacterium]